MPFWAVVSSEGEECTMSVTGRMGPGCMSGGVEESVWSEGGRGGGGGEALGRTLGEITSLMHEEAGSTSWESPKGASPVEDSSTISKWMSGMSALVSAILSESVVGAPSCIVGTGEVSKGAGVVSSVNAGSDFSAISPL